MGKQGPDTRKLSIATRLSHIVDDLMDLKCDVFASRARKLRDDFLGAELPDQEDSSQGTFVVDAEDTKSTKKGGKKK